MRGARPPNTSCGCVLAAYAGCADTQTTHAHVLCTLLTSSECCDPRMRNSCFPAENIAETTFRRHPADGAPLWRPGLPSSLSRSSLRSGLHVLAQGTTPPLNLSSSLNPSASQPLSLASPQHAQQPEPHTGGPSSGPGSLLLGLFDCSALGSQGQAAQGQAHAPPAVSLAVLPPLSLQPPPPPPPPLLPQPRPTAAATAATPPPSSLSTDTTTLELCDPQRIKEEASEETSVHAVAPTPDTTTPMSMSSAPSVRPYPLPLQATPSAMKAGMAPVPPSSIPIPMPPPGLGLPLVPPPPSPMLATTPAAAHLDVNSPLLCLPSPSPLIAPPANASGDLSLSLKPESPIAHTRRAARTPPMLVRSTQAQHTLAVRLPAGLAPEMVTISAKKGARLAVVADLWHREDDSHYEWEVVFSPADVDMMSVRAVFEADGQLMIHVRRRPAAAVTGGEGFPPPLVCAR
ncbi:hypothetical protein GSI_02055 [Ganoderma sinense ZZ0214-1]|uniref:SHSP domain-containing protein n=1 Tax=Ganoderma sinense ZZ0214-1 TaxID=1077348 RepID=A0A2G8SNK0_9APHY|nr:hypothetical protein GSI_02055 [Ganoderma sinense ZZ0214-1]